MRVMQSKFTKTNLPPNFQTGGRARRAGPWSVFAQTQRILPRRDRAPGLEIPGSATDEVLFYAPFTHTMCFVVMIENKVHVVNTVWWLQLKYTHVVKSKITNTNHLKISNASLLDPPLALVYNTVLTYSIYIYN